MTQPPQQEWMDTTNNREIWMYLSNKNQFHDTEETFISYVHGWVFSHFAEEDARSSRELLFGSFWQRNKIVMERTILSPYRIPYPTPNWGRVGDLGGRAKPKAAPRPEAKAHPIRCQWAQSHQSPMGWPHGQSYMRHIAFQELDATVIQKQRTSCSAWIDQTSNVRKRTCWFMIRSRVFTTFDLLGSSIIMHICCIIIMNWESVLKRLYIKGWPAGALLTYSHHLGFQHATEGQPGRSLKLAGIYHSQSLQKDRKKL